MRATIQGWPMPDAIIGELIEAKPHGDLHT